MHGRILTACLFSWTLLQMTATCLEAQTAAEVRATATAFHVDTDIYAKPGNKEPDWKMLTLFKDSVYYDFTLDDARVVTMVTMIDPLDERIIKLSPRDRIKTTFKTKDLYDYVAKIQKDITGGELANIMAAASKVSFDQQKNVLRVGDERMAYEATLQTPRDLSMAQQYADFADWSARLNTILPPNFPPFLRLELNRQILNRGLLPETVTRTARHNGQSSAVKTRMMVVAALSRDDEAMIHSVGEMLTVFKEVSQQEFVSGKPTMVGSSSSPGAGVRK